MGLRQDILNQPVTDLALRPLIQVSATATVAEAIAIMRQHELGCVMVLDEDGQPLGMFNEKLLIRMLVDDKDYLDHPVSEFMTTELVTVSQSDRIADLLHTMQTHKLRWVCVVDGEGRAAAITGLRGLVEYVVDHVPRCVLVEPIRRKLSMEQREGA